VAAAAATAAYDAGVLELVFALLEAAVYPLYDDRHKRRQRVRWVVSSKHRKRARILRRLRP